MTLRVHHSDSAWPTQRQHTTTTAKARVHQSEWSRQPEARQRQRAGTTVTARIHHSDSARMPQRQRAAHAPQRKRTGTTATALGRHGNSTQAPAAIARGRHSAWTIQRTTDIARTKATSNTIFKIIT